MASTDFDTDTALERVDDATFRGRLDRRWWIVRGPNGGYLAAVILRALQERLADAERRTRSLTIHYLEAPAEGDVTITTAVERSGRSLSTLSATMQQGGRAVAKAIAAFSRPREAVEFSHLTMPDVPPPEEVAPITMEGMTPPMTANFEMRPAVGAPPFSGAAEAVSGGWIRLKQPRPLDDPELAMLTDAWVPAVFSMMSAFGVGVPTVDLTIHFRAPVPQPPPPDDFYLCVFRSRVAVDGFVEEDGEIWHRDGVLLAQSRQLAVLT